MNSRAVDVHPAWLPPGALRAVGARRVAVVGDGPLVRTVRAEVVAATAAHGGACVPPGPGCDLELGLDPGDPEVAGPDSYRLVRAHGCTRVTAGTGAGLLYGFFHVVRLGEGAFGADLPAAVHAPAHPRRMLDHWDNVAVHPVMGQVERGYAGGSLFWADGGLRDDLRRVGGYARLLAACGVNAISVNNVNVHETEAHLLTDRIGDVAAIADLLRPYGVRAHLSVNFASPLLLGGLPTADPLDPDVRRWWRSTVEQVYRAVPDLGGFVVKADSEGQPGPFAYGRTHADGANMLAEALAPFGGVVHWRAFVYDHRQDWRDRSTDRARAAHDHFAPLDGTFADGVVLQVKHGPIDFQPREPVSPVLAAMPRTALAVELQVTQEYTGQQKHVCYLGPLWSQALGFHLAGPAGPCVADLVHGGGVVGVSNVGDDEFWTGHPLAQANLYAFGRLAWDPHACPIAVLDEWIDLTFVAPLADAAGATDARAAAEVREVLHAMMDGSWLTYERYTAPLGVGFMVSPANRHYGPDVDGYEYSPWGTYHFADRDGVGVDRSVATGTGYAAQYPEPWRSVYESPATCPDELLLFFHHVPYGHVLHSGSTVVQHIYDTHFAGVREVQQMVQLWARPGLEALVGPAVHARTARLLDEQLRCAREWRDQVNTYFWRKSGVPDAHGRTIH